MAGLRLPPSCLQTGSLEVLGLLGAGRRETDRRGREEKIFPKLRRAVGAYPQKCIISPRFVKNLL